MALAVGEAELHRFGDGVNVLHAVVAERRDVDTVEQTRHLGEHRPLAPGSTGVELDLSEPCNHRLFDRALVLGEVLHRQPAAGFFVVPNHGAGEVAPVEGVARGDQAGLSPCVRRRRRFLVDHVLDCVAKVGLYETFAHPGRLAAREIDVPIRRPAAVAIRMGNEISVHQGGRPRIPRARTERRPMRPPRIPSCRICAARQSRHPAQPEPRCARCRAGRKHSTGVVQCGAGKRPVAHVTPPMAFRCDGRSFLSRRISRASALALPESSQKRGEAPSCRGL